MARTRASEVSQPRGPIQISLHPMVSYDDRLFAIRRPDGFGLLHHDVPGPSTDVIRLLDDPGGVPGRQARGQAPG